MSHARYAVRRLRLNLIADGGAELLEGERQLWASDADLEWAEEFGTEILDENDIDGILEYLIDSGRISVEEADRAEIRAELLEDGPGDEGEDEDDEDDILIEGQDFDEEDDVEDDDENEAA